MKTLLLMRHGKSSWAFHDLDDHARPLKKRGKKDAQRIGKLLKDEELVPQKIISSTAERARLTAVAVTEASGSQDPVEYTDSFYMAEPETYLNYLRSLPDSLERVMIIGHNPGLEGLLQVLSRQVESLPTGAIAYLSLPIKTWQELNSEVRCDLVDLFKPKNLK